MADSAITPVLADRQREVVFEEELATFVQP